MRSGKDTVAEYLIDRHYFNISLAFGDKLKEIAHMIFPDVSRESKPRELYQFMNVMRDYDEDVWVKHLAHTYQQYLANTLTVSPRVVITDLRQQNELNWCKANDFLIVRVDSPKQLRLERARGTGDSFNENSLNHKTEKEVKGFDVDYEIVNDGDLEELYGKVDEMMKFFVGDGIT